MIKGMEMHIKTNKILPDNWCIVPGGYHFIYNGKEFWFDFLDTEGYSTEEENVYSLIVHHLDFDYSEDAISLLNDAILPTVEYCDFYFDCNEDTDYYPVSVERLWYIWEDSDDCIMTLAPKHQLDKINSLLTN